MDGVLRIAFKSISFFYIPVFDQIILNGSLMGKFDLKFTTKLF